MRITHLTIRNYRTLENLSLDLASPYIALCGPNDSGKTNLVRAVRALMRGRPESTYRYRDQPEFSIKDDYPKWKSEADERRRIEIEASIEADRDHDAALYQFLVVRHNSYCE